MTFTPNMTLAEAQIELVRQAESGVECPCCFQFAKVYKRKVNRGMARLLVEMYRTAGVNEYVHTPSLSVRTHEGGQLAWWDLIEELQEKREDGGRAGWWRVTQKGEDWIRGKVTVPKYAVIYNGDRLELEGEATTVQQALGKKFRLDELMAGV